MVWKKIDWPTHRQSYDRTILVNIFPDFDTLLRVRPPYPRRGNNTRDFPSRDLFAFARTSADRGAAADCRRDIARTVIPIIVLPDFSFNGFELLFRAR